MHALWHAASGSVLNAPRLASPLPHPAPPPLPLPLQYLKPEKEAEADTRPEVEATLPKEWPNAGSIVATKLAMRYRPDTPLVLRSELLLLLLLPGCVAAEVASHWLPPVVAASSLLPEPGVGCSTHMPPHA
jgi:hypothetical protein